MNENDLQNHLIGPSAAARAVEPFSKYRIEPDGTCWRVVPSTRGRHAGDVRRVSPTIHPKGHQWYVMLFDDSGIRHRVPVKRLVEQAFGLGKILTAGQ